MIDRAELPPRRAATGFPARLSALAQRLLVDVALAIGAIAAPFAWTAAYARQRAARLADRDAFISRK